MISFVSTEIKSGNLEPLFISKDEAKTMALYTLILNSMTKNQQSVCPFSVALFLCRVTGNLELRPGATRWGTFWTGCQPITMAHSHTTESLEMPISLPSLSLDWRRNPEYQEEVSYHLLL